MRNDESDWLPAEASLDQMTATLREAHKKGVFTDRDRLADMMESTLKRDWPNAAVRERALTSMLALAIDRLARWEWEHA